MDIKIIKHIYMQTPEQPLKFFGTMITSGSDRHFIPADPRAAMLPEEIMSEVSGLFACHTEPDHYLPFELDGTRLHWN